MLNPRFHPAPIALAMAVVLASHAATAPAHAQATAAPVSITLPAQPLGTALSDLARQARLQLMVNADLVAGKTAPAVSGRLTVREALDRLLAGSGLEASVDGEEVIVRKAGAVVPASSEVTLPTLKVTAQGLKDGTSEGTGSYAARYSNSATKLDLTPLETPQSVTVITRQMMEDKGLLKVEQVLQHTPGITLVGDSSEGSQIFVRGFALESGLFIDGLNTTSAMPTYDGSISQGQDLVVFDRVEVIKGAAGIVGGLGTPSASVNMVRKRPTHQFQAHAEAAVGSWNRVNAEGDVSGPLNDSGSLRGRLVTAVRKGDSYIDRYHTDKSVVYGVVDLDLSSRTTLSVALDYWHSDTHGIFSYSSNPAFYTDGGLFQPSRSFSTAQDWTYSKIRQTSLTPTIEHRFDNGWTGKLSLRRAEATLDRVQYFPGDYVNRATGALVGAWSLPYANRSTRQSNTDSIDAYATGRFSLLGRSHDLSFGASYGKNEFSMTSFRSGTLAAYNIHSGDIPAAAISDTPTSSARYAQQQAGAFATARFNPTDDLKVMVGGRLSNWEYTTTNLLQNSSKTVQYNDIVTPYLGVVYQLTKQASAYASYTGVFRPLTYFGADGNLLEPAEGSNKEVGLKFNLLDEKLILSVAAYETLEDNYPEFANAGMLPSGDWIYRSIDGIKTTGYEIEMSGRLAPGWEASGGYTHNKAKDATGQPKFTYVPQHSVKLATSRKFGDGFTLGGGLRWQSASHYDTAIYAASPALAVRQEQRAYALLDLMARWQVNPRYAVTLNVNNVFDKVYNRSIWGYADYGEPRNVMVALRAKW